MPKKRTRIIIAAGGLLVLSVLAVLVVRNVYRFRPNRGAGSEKFEGPRRASPNDVLVPAGYRVELVATGLTFPTGVAFDDSGRLHVIEAGYSYGERWTIPRLLRVEGNGTLHEVARGSKPPWTGVSFSNGAFLITEGGQRDGGRIIRVTADGSVTVVVDSLPTVGDHHANRAVAGPDGYVYFGVGTATNSGVVGPDNFEFGWLKRHPSFRDVPCEDITLAGENFESPNPLSADPNDRAITGAFSPFGSATRRGQTIAGSVPCSGSVLRVRASGGAVELVAWGFRNPFGLAFAPDGRLYVAENGFDVRGSRGVFGSPDHLYLVTPGAWYGWPDLAGGIPVNQERFKPRDGVIPRRILLRQPRPPQRPIARLAVHSSSNGFDFSRSALFGHVGEAFVAQFGDMTPKTGKVWEPVGARLVRVNVATGDVRDFMTNRGKIHGPASWMGNAGIERPVDARFDSSGEALYVTDFGVMTVTEAGPMPHANTGVVWRITRARP